MLLHCIPTRLCYNVLQAGLTALDLAKTQEIRELLLDHKQFAKEETELDNQQQDTETEEPQVKSESVAHQNERETDFQASKEFTEVGDLYITAISIKQIIY